MAMVLLFPPGIYPEFYPVGNCSKGKKGQVIFLLLHRRCSRLLRAARSSWVPAATLGI